MATGQQFETLERSIEQAILTITQIGITAGDFQTTSQPVLNQQIQTLIANMRDMEQLRSSFDGIKVPMEVFDYVDNGKNPQLYTKHCLEKAVEKRQEEQAKLEAYQVCVKLIELTQEEKRIGNFLILSKPIFRTSLLNELQAVFPEQIEQYKAARHLKDL